MRGTSRGVFDVRAGSGGCEAKRNALSSRRLKSHGSGEPAARHWAFLGGFVWNACQRKYGEAEKVRQRWIKGKSTGDYAKQAVTHRREAFAWREWRKRHARRDAGTLPAPT